MTAYSTCHFTNVVFTQPQTTIPWATRMDTLNQCARACLLNCLPTSHFRHRDIRKPVLQALDAAECGQKSSPDVPPSVRASTVPAAPAAKAAKRILTQRIKYKISMQAQTHARAHALTPPPRHRSAAWRSSSPASSSHRRCCSHSSRRWIIM